MRKKVMKGVSWTAQRSFIRPNNQIPLAALCTKPQRVHIVSIKKQRSTDQSSVIPSCLRSPELAQLEAALFVAREPLPIRRLAKLALMEPVLVHFYENLVPSLMILAVLFVLSISLGVFNSLPAPNSAPGYVGPSTTLRRTGCPMLPWKPCQ